MLFIDYCDAGLLWNPIPSAWAYQYDSANATMRPLPLPGVDESQTPSGVDSFIHYRGVWGDERYPDSHPDQETVPYFGIKRFISGPTGPIMKALVRKGLEPEPRRLSWLEWAVQKFMALYPYCFRGWRKWITCAVVVLMLLVVGLTTRCLIVRRRRRRAVYTKVDTDIPMDEFGSEADSGSETRKSIESREHLQ